MGTTHSNLRLVSLLFLVVAFVAPDARSRQDITSARAEYVAAVRDKISAELLDGLETDVAKAAILKLAAVPDGAALAILVEDAKRVADRLYDWGVKLERAKMSVEQNTKDLKDAPQDKRDGIEARVKDAEKDLAKAKLLFPQLRELNSAMTEGLLLSIETVGTANPAEVWEGLVAGLESDMVQLAKTDELVRTNEAGLKSFRDKLSGAKENDRDELEKKGAELAGRVLAGKELIAQLTLLRARRVEVLAKIFPKLEKARQSKEVSAIKANLKDDAPAAKRAFSVELYGCLPLPDAYSVPLGLMKKASNERDKVEKALEPLREQFERAAKSYGQMASSNQMTAAVENALRSAQANLTTAGAKSAEAARLVAAAARGIGRAIAAMEPAPRQKSANELLKLAQTYSDKIVRSSVLSAFALVNDEKVTASLRDLVVKDPEINTRLAALDVLAEIGDAATIDLCGDTLLKDKEWRIRAAAMRALVRLPSKKGIASLIGSIGNEVGRLIEDAEQALAELTGQHFNGDANLWKDWWAKNEASFDPVAFAKGLDSPDAGTTAAGGEDWRKAGGHVSFYGITTRSSRILFVLDRSGSMLEPATDSLTGKAGGENKFEVAKSQLATAINGLKDGDVFNLVHYSTDVERWTKQMQKSSPESRKKATGFIDKELKAIGGTNVYDALREAFRLAGIGGIDKAYESNVDTIFFLTDGEPTQGEVLEPEEILRRVREWNKLSRIVVHTVGVGKDHNSAFLRRLAEENGGMYVSR